MHGPAGECRRLMMVVSLQVEVFSSTPSFSGSKLELGRAWLSQAKQSAGFCFCFCFYFYFYFYFYFSFIVLAATPASARSVL